MESNSRVNLGVRGRRNCVITDNHDRIRANECETDDWEDEGEKESERRKLERVLALSIAKYI